MARLASQEKGGFYPLPETVTELIATHLGAPHGGRLLDPCCGEGYALVTLARELGLEPYGVELNTNRAEAGAELVNELLTARGIEPELRIIHGDYKLTLNTTPNGYNCLYLNPPYDTDRDSGRLEYKSLVETRPYLQADGLLICVIPQHVLLPPDSSIYKSDRRSISPPVTEPSKRGAVTSRFTELLATFHPPRAIPETAGHAVPACIAVGF